ncbi:MAG: hypothetical protein AMXMBFR83_09280 [Phycisphaerae bacterium]|jgi:glucan phosphoethanolaminetransferase (alkaline phosphatase superfamily)
MTMSPLDCLSAAAVMMALFLGLLSYPRLGRAAVPLTLLALMAATSSMSLFTETVGILMTVLLGRAPDWWFAMTHHPVSSHVPGVLAVFSLAWLIWKIRRLPS